MRTAIKLGAALAILSALGGFALHYGGLRAQAARVPALEQRLDSWDQRANELADRLLEIETARAQADTGLDEWISQAGGVLAELQRNARHARASVNPDCHPAPDDRRLRNEALGRLLRDQPD